MRGLPRVLGLLSSPPPLSRAPLDPRPAGWQGPCAPRAWWWRCFSAWTAPDRRSPHLHRRMPPVTRSAPFSRDCSPDSSGCLKPLCQVRRSPLLVPRAQCRPGGAWWRYPERSSRAGLRSCALPLGTWEWSLCPGPTRSSKGGRKEGCVWTVAVPPGLTLLSGKVLVGGSAGMACSGAPIFRGGREGGSFLSGPRRSGTPHRAGASGIRHPHSHIRARISTLAGPRLQPFFP